MKNLVGKSVKLSLVGLDGNASSLLGAFQKQAKREQWSTDEINKVITEAKNGDYEHLIDVLFIHTYEDEDFEDVDDEDDGEWFAEDNPYGPY